MTGQVKRSADGTAAAGRNWRRAALGASLLALAACGDRTPRRTPAGAGTVAVTGSVATLWAERDGRAYWNREPVTAVDLRDSLAALHGRRNVALWYARARPDSEPTPAQMAVLQAVINAKVSVRMVEPGRPELRMMTPDTAR